MTQRTEVSITPVTPTGSSTGPWSTVWLFGDVAEVAVWLALPGEDAEPLDAADITVTAPSPLENGGMVEIAADLVPEGGWASGTRLWLVRQTPTGQAFDIDISGRVPLKTIERAIDRVSRQVQDLWRELGRALKVGMGLTAPQISTAREGVLYVDEDGEIIIRTDLVGQRGPKGDPGGGGGAVGLVSDFPDLSIPAGTDMVQVTGRTRIGDAAMGKFLVRPYPTRPTPENPDGVLLDFDSDILDAEGNRWRWAPDQPYCLEMFHDDPVNHGLTAMRAMADLINYWGHGEVKCAPGVTYGPAGFPPKTTTPNKFTSRTFRRDDGREITHAYVTITGETQRDPHWVGLSSFKFDGRGCRFLLDGEFNLTAADYASGYRKMDTPILFDFWKGGNVVLEDFTWDGGWGDQTTDTGASGECHSYCIRLTGVAGCEVRRVIARNGAQDFIVTAHRNKASLNSIALVSTEAYPEPDQSTDEVFDPAGICHSLVVRSCVVDSFRRQGLSPVGIGFRDLEQDFPGLTIEDTIVSNIGRYPGSAPRWFTGDPTDGSVKWMWRGFPPRSAVDFEPVRVAGYQVTDNVFRNCNFIDCIGSFAASTGSWKRLRVEQSLPFSAVDVTSNTFSKAALTLPRTRRGGIPAKIRCWSDDTLPGGLAERTDYYLSKTSDTAFRLHATPADAIAGTNPVNITTQGAGNHWFIWYETPPNVGKITFDGCTLRHPADGSVLPMQVNCEHLRVVNCDIHIAAGSAFTGPNAVYEERQTWENNRITYVRAGFDVDNYPFIKSQALGAAIDTAAETLTLDVDDGLGKYEFVPLKMKVSGAGAAMPGGLSQGPTVWMARTGALTRKFAANLEAARNGTWTNLTDQGAGTLSYYRDQAQYDVKGNSFEHMPRLLEFDASQVSTTTGRIPIPSMPYRREGVSDSEHFEVVAVTTGAGLPPGFDALTTYYAFMDYEDDSGVYLAATSADATARIAVIPTAVGSGKCRLAATVTQAQIDILDANCRFTDNSIIVDMNDVTGAGTMVRLAGLSGFCGGNHLTTKGGSSRVPTISYARMTVDKADVLKGGFISTGP